MKRQAVKKQNKGYTTRLVNRALEIMEELAECKALYEELDELTDKLGDYGFTSKELGIDENGNLEVLSLVDNFQHKNTVWKAAAVRRYELKKQVIKETKK